MAVYRIKRFAATQQENSMYGQQKYIPQIPDPTDMTSKDLRIENMRLQKEMMRNQRQEQRLREEERKQVLQSQREAQKQEQKNDREEDKNQIRAKESQNKGNNAQGIKDPSLYKKATTAIKPISMK